MKYQYVVPEEAVKTDIDIQTKRSVAIHWGNFAWANEVSVTVITTLILCDTMDCSPSGSSVHGILQARILGVGCHSLLQRIFRTQGSDLGLQNCRQILSCLSHQRRYKVCTKLL